MFSDDLDEEHACFVTKLSTLKIPAASPHTRILSQRMADAAPITKSSQRPKQALLTAIAFDSLRHRLFYGLDNGETSFWVIDDKGVAGSSRYVGLHKGPVSFICAPPLPNDGPLGRAGLLLTGSVTGNIKVWDYQGKVLHEPTITVQTLYGHTGTVTGLFAYGVHIISCSTDGTIRVWAAVGGRGHLAYPWYEQQSIIATLDGWVRSMTFDRGLSPGDHGVFFAVSDIGSIVRIIPDEIVQNDGQSLSKSQIFILADMPGMDRNSHASALANSSHDRGVLQVRFVDAWKKLFSVSYDNCIRGYDVVTGALEHEWVEPATDEVLAVDALGWLSIFSVKTGRLFATKQLAQEPILSITKAMGRQCYAVSTSREVTLWEVDHDLDYNVMRGGHDKAVVALYACSGGPGAVEGDRDFRVFSASLDCTVRLWDPYDLACVRVLGGEEAQSEISSMTYYEGWRILVTGHDNGDIRLWDADSGRSHHTLHQHTNTVSCMCMALVRSNEEMLITGGFDGNVCLWDLRSLRGRDPPHMVGRFKAHGPGSESRLGSISMNSPGPQAAATAAVPAWQTGGADQEVLAVKFDPIKMVIYTAGNDQSIRVWSVQGFAFRGHHEGHTAPVTCLTIDANFLFSGSDDCNIRVWDAVPAEAVASMTRAEELSPSPITVFCTTALKVLCGHTSTVTALEVLDGCGGQLVSCSLDGSLRFWDYVTGQQLHRYNHHEEFRCLAIRADKPEVLVGTTQASILRYAFPGNILTSELTSTLPQENNVAPGYHQNGGPQTDDNTLNVSSSGSPNNPPLAARAISNYTTHDVCSVTENDNENEDGGNIMVCSGSIPSDLSPANKPKRSQPRRAEDVGLFNTRLVLPAAVVKARTDK